ncbi:MAG: tRNA pseudouridine(38-40) synthase TruA [Actinomycetes bacterium]
MGQSARWRMTVAYRGTMFHGFAKQPGMQTVAGELADALQRITQEETSPLIVCAGRTDAGVHAIAQVIHVDLVDPLPSTRDGERGPDELRHSLNRQLGGDISIIDAVKVSPEFDARHSARWRRYRYLILESATPNPLLAELAWHVSEPLDVRAMAQASGAVIGSHDFRCFCRKVAGTTSAEPIVRLVTHASVDVVDTSESFDLFGGRLIRFEIQASAFCHQMVRSIAGQLVEIGRGRSNGADIVALLHSQSREGAAQPAPSHGLCLVGVGYGPEAGLPKGPISP